MYILLKKKYHLPVLITTILLYSLLMVYTIQNGGLYYQIAVLGIPTLLLAIYFAVYLPEIYFYVLVLLLPLSLNIEDLGYGIGISLPAEILTAVLTVLVFVNLLRGGFFEKALLRHPLTLVLMFDLLWMIVTAITSTMPLISIKYILIRFGFLLVFYLFVAQVFRDISSARNIFWLYGISLLVVILFSTAKHSQFGFIQQVNHWAPKPFFKDHTIYGAAIVMVLPFFISNIFSGGKQKQVRILSLAVIPLLMVGLYLSYSRAAWISMAGVVLVSIFILFRVKFRQIFPLIILGILVLWFFRMPIIHRLQDVESQRGGDDLKEHITSAANIESSASNKERINRWMSAFAMIREKPIMGFGPGTYQFQYGPYQDLENMTHISTYFGDRGGVHSEYLKPLVESGMIGLIIFLSIVLITLQRAFKLVYSETDRQKKVLLISVLLGLVSYYIHGFVNFFSNTDKIAVLFWGMTAFIVAVDLDSRKSERFLKNKDNKAIKINA